MKKRIFIIFITIFAYSFFALEPGYTLINGSPQWTPNINHPNHKNVIAGKQKNTWLPAPGYAWINEKDNDFSVKWVPGKRNPFFPNVIAGEKENNWSPAPGYKWASNKANDFRVIKEVEDDADNATEEFTFDCKKCKGSGQIDTIKYVECPECNGGRKKCGSCKGSGKTSMFGGWICTLCMGDGKASSYCSCHGSGTINKYGKKTCPQCNGKGKISL